MLIQDAKDLIYNKRMNTHQRAEQRFPGLDLLRIYAALGVVMWHTNPHAGVSSQDMPGLLSGWDAVTLFFTLSGFIISYLLLKERERSGTIAIGAFYLRRVLRIWSVYFLVVFAVMIAFPMLAVPATVLLLVPNLNLAVLPGILGQLWSIGAEEQFYLFWPWLVRRVGFAKLCWTIIGVRWLLLAVTTTALYGFGDTSNALYSLHEFLVRNRFDAMAIGSLFAYLLYRRSPVLQVVYRLFPLVLAAFVVVTILPMNKYGDSLYDSVLAVLCGLMIVNVIRFPALDFPMARALGNLSYGVYMYHNLVLFVLAPNVVDSSLLLILVPGVTLILAVLSYRYFERPFLRLKTRFEPRSAAVLAPAGN